MLLSDLYWVNLVFLISERFENKNIASRKGWTGLGIGPRRSSPAVHPERGKHVLPLYCTSRTFVLCLYQIYLLLKSFEKQDIQKVVRNDHFQHQRKILIVPRFEALNRDRLIAMIGNFEINERFQIPIAVKVYIIIFSRYGRPSEKAKTHQCIGWQPFSLNYLSQVIPQMMSSCIPWYSILRRLSYSGYTWGSALLNF